MRSRASFSASLSLLRASKRICAAALGLFLLSCAAMPTDTLVGLPPLSDEGEIRLQAGDTVELDFVYWPELHATQTIRADGIVSLAEIGDVRAAGLTTAEFKKDLERRYETLLKAPSINVILRSRPPQHVFVGGEVRSPGFITLAPMTDGASMPAYLGNNNRVVFQGRLTLSQVLLAAGGFENRSANLSNVVVVRYRDGKRFAAVFDARQCLEGRESEPVYLAGNDIVYVPRTKIDRVNQWVDQYLSEIVPQNLQGIVTQSSSNGRRQVSVGVAP